MAKDYPFINSVTPQTVTPILNLKTENAGGNVYNHYDSLITVEGNVDKYVIGDLKQLGRDLLKNRDFMDGAYQYTTGRIVRDVHKMGINV